MDSTTTFPFSTTADFDPDALPSIRLQERWMLVLAGLFILINHITLIIVREQSVFRLWPVTVWIACAVVGHTVLNRRLPDRDALLFPLAMFLTGWGLNLIARLQPSYTLRQTLWMVVGLAALLAITALPADLRWLRRYRYTWLVGGLALLGITILFGQNPSGAGPRLWVWLGFGRIYYQPSELLKIVLVAFLASYFADHQQTLRLYTVRFGASIVPSPVFLGPVLLMWGICVVVLVWQRDLGTATLFFVVFMVMLYLASEQGKLLLGGLALLLAAGAVAYRLFDVVALRVNVWWNPWPTADSDAYQVVQSLMAIASGGLFGRGMGQGQPTIVPVVHSDFAFAAIGEEWGLLGLLVALIVLAVLTVRGMRVAVMAQGPFRMLLSAGLSVMLAMQSLLIMGGVLKLIPLTGVTLPFVSYGGSSLLTCFVIAGLLLVLSCGRSRTV
jgi:cell division protein FtsW (lipid II flippase)